MVTENLLSAAEARRQTSYVRELDSERIREQVESVLGQIQRYVQSGYYSILVHNKLSPAAIEFLRDELGYRFNKYEDGDGFLISW